MKRNFIIILFSAAFFKSYAQDSVSTLPKARHAFIVVAHRGDHTEAPENTLRAFENAIRNDVDYVEIDLRTTKDSQLIIMHDASVDRMTNGKGLVRDLTLAEIRKLKVKDKSHPEWGEFAIPMFREVMELCKDKINIYLDFKNADVAETYKQLLEFQMEKQVLVYINEEKQFYQWRKIEPKIPLMVSLPASVKDNKSLKTFLSKDRVEVLDGSYREYTSEMVKAATEMGCAVLPDIQQPNENAELWEPVIQMAVYGLQTDHPASLVRYLKEKKLR